MTALDRQFADAAARKALVIPAQVETQRLILRASAADDLDASHDLAERSAAELAPWMPWAYPEPLRASMKNYFDTVEQKWDAREQLDFQWFEKASGALIGKGGFHHIDWTIPKFEIGYWLGTPYSGRGYCTEAVNGLAAFAFAHLGAGRLEIRSQPTNRRSCAVAERAGFVLEGVSRQSLVRVDGTLGDACMYAKLTA
jgi:RimJ/RimL family protein N-acetyltransferase